jgi:hypothetical protein
MIAACRCDIDMVNILLKAGATIPNKISGNKLVSMNLEVITWLLNNYDVQYDEINARITNIDYLKIIFEHRIPFNYELTLPYATKRGQFNILQILVDNNITFTLDQINNIFSAALYYNNIDWIKYSLDHNANIFRIEVDDLLILPISTIKLLINNYVDVNEIFRRCDLTDYESLEFVIKSGADVYKYGYSVLIYTVCNTNNNNIRNIKLLIKSGINTDDLTRVINNFSNIDPIIYDLLIMNGGIKKLKNE